MSLSSTRYLIYSDICRNLEINSSLSRLNVYNLDVFKIRSFKYQIRMFYTFYIETIKNNLLLNRAQIHYFESC